MLSPNTSAPFSLYHLFIFGQIASFGFTRRFLQKTAAPQKTQEIQLLIKNNKLKETRMLCRTDGNRCIDM